MTIRTKQRMTPLNYGTFLLSRKDYAIEAFRQKLLVHYHDDPAILQSIDELIARFEELGYLDDERYACRYAQLEANRLRGPCKVRWSLQQQQVKPTFIEQALAAVDWYDVCCRAFFKKGGDQGLFDWQYAFRYLASRGFASEQIQECLSSMKAHRVSCPQVTHSDEI